MRERHEIWGDDPEERDASDVVTQALSDAEIERQWHDHPGIAPFKLVARFIGRNAKRVAVTIAGFTVVIVGLILVPLPGPGWLIVFAGLTKVGQAKDVVLRKNRPADADPPA
jgi:hypothetical protein